MIEENRKICEFVKFAIIRTPDPPNEAHRIRAWANTARVGPEHLLLNGRFFSFTYYCTVEACTVPPLRNINTVVN
jgi:hypothetical protein